jgi:hypothetical protein
MNDELPGRTRIEVWMEKHLNAALMLELMQLRCAGNYNRFARELGIDAGHLYRFLHTGVGGGKKSSSG